MSGATATGSTRRSNWSNIRASLPVAPAITLPKLVPVRGSSGGRATRACPAYADEVPVWRREGIAGRTAHRGPALITETVADHLTCPPAGAAAWMTRAICGSNTDRPPLVIRMPDERSFHNNSNSGYGARRSNTIGVLSFKQARGLSFRVQ